MDMLLGQEETQALFILKNNNVSSHKAMIIVNLNEV